MIHASLPKEPGYQSLRVYRYYHYEPQTSVVKFLLHQLEVPDSDLQGVVVEKEQ